VEKPNHSQSLVNIKIPPMDTLGDARNVPKNILNNIERHPQEYINLSREETYLGEITPINFFFPNQ